MPESLRDKARKLFLVNDETDDEIESELSSKEEQIEIKYRGVNTFKQVKEVCECLKKDFPVIINLQSATPEIIGRVTDYLSGVLDAIDGEIVAIGVNMWVCTPKNVVVEGKYVELIQQEIEEKGFTKRPNNRASMDDTFVAQPSSPYGTKR
jgi:FtsZ-interacting cell division protein YlmF